MSEEKYDGKIESREFLPESDGSGMGLSGKWMNKRTGQYINIRQTIQEGDNMIIISDKGQIPMDVFSRDYLQVSDDIYDEQGKIIGNEAPKIQNNDDLGAIEEYEKMYGVDSLTPQVQQSVTINNEQIIKKIFDKLTSFPEIDVNIKWDNFPEAQINTLVEFLDVKIEDISAYIIKKYINTETLSLKINEVLNEKLHIEDNKNIELTTNE
jgi:hypothetical protein